MTTTIVSTILSLYVQMMSSDIICCATAPDGNMKCHLPSIDGQCDSGDKAVVCRYGVWSDKESGAAECIPAP